jgi:[ribosomal protein S5]-alanine N-acetyltransferase
MKNYTTELANYLPILNTNRLQIIGINQDGLLHITKSFSQEELLVLFNCTNEQLTHYTDLAAEGMHAFRLRHYYFLIINNATNITVAEAGFHTWNTKHNKCELFYNVKKDEYKRQGYISEALNAIFNYGYHTLNLHRIEARVEKNNVASKAVLNHFNFTYEGVARQEYNTLTAQDDSEVWSLLKHEFVYI